MTLARPALRLTLEERETRPLVLDLKVPYNGSMVWECDAYVLTELQLMFMMQLAQDLLSNKDIERIVDLFHVFKDVLRDIPDTILFNIRPSQLLQLAEYLSPSKKLNDLPEEMRMRVAAVFESQDTSTFEVRKAVMIYIESHEVLNETALDELLRACEVTAS